MPDLTDYDRAVNPKGEKCAHCGEIARGYAYIGGERYCHPDDAESCYVDAQIVPGGGTVRDFARWLATETGFELHEDSPMRSPRPDPAKPLGGVSEGRDAPGQAENGES